ncbi:VOC family protein [Virgibacillus siamensis]|uniref:VOC family protein n=1 Tax=Virgibacillus siamensis TaxID=480071 RepID=UPI0009846FA5|nr:VOC family protein [Virgibacillus siamensis]
MEQKFFVKPATYVGEVNINVTDLERSIEFYQSVIGFDVLEKTENKAVLTADHNTALLTLEQPDDAMRKEIRTTGLYHFAILLPSRADLSAFLRHIARAGIQIGAADHYVSEALYLSDPDGNGIEVYRDRSSSEWTWTENEVSMGTDPLDGESLLAESKDEWHGLPDDTVMGHIHLHVADLEAVKPFYMDALGFQIVTTYPGALFISTGDYHHHIGLNIWNGQGAPAPSENSAGLNWFTLVYPDRETREEVVKCLENIGADVKKDDNDYITKDPSGNRIRLVAAE